MKFIHAHCSCVMCSLYVMYVLCKQIVTERVTAYKESPRGAASGNFFRLQTSLLSLFLVQMG